MKQATFWAVALHVCFWTQSVCGFELATHAQITQQAYLQSILYDPTIAVADIGQSFANNLGIGSYVWGEVPLTYATGSFKRTITPFGTRYFDVRQDTNSVVRTGSEELEGKIFYALDYFPNTLDGWLMRGAIREDDNPKLFAADDPDPYTYPSFYRVFNHFFDPVNNIPLTVSVFGVDTVSNLYWLSSGSSTVRKAPDWAAGTDDVFANAGQRGSDTLNHFTIFDAHEAMWRALTGMRWSDSAPISASGASAASAEDDRKGYWATMFRALGDILHLNQDMAQPQHTRNEPHAGGMLANLLSGHTSIFETYLDCRANPKSCQNGFVIDNTTLTVQPSAENPLPLTGYASPQFPHIQDFWSTGPGQGNYSGRGLADYSNHGFFSYANNVNDTNYTQPPRTAGAYTTQQVTFQGRLPGLYYAVNYLMGTVTDNNAAVPLSQGPIHMSRTGLFDGFSASVDYVLDKTIYDDQASLLLPRAVGYSAGILNHFFRGSLAISPPPSGLYAAVDEYPFVVPPTNGSPAPTGLTQIKLSLQNTTPQITDPLGQATPQDMTGGTLIAVVKYHNNICYKSNLTGEYSSPGLSMRACRNPPEQIATSLPVKQVQDGSGSPISLPSGGAPQVFSFDFSTSPIPLSATDLYLQVVYRGPLGGEPDNVVVATKDISEPTYVSVFNATGNFVCVNGQFAFLSSTGTSDLIQDIIKAAGGDPNTIKSHDFVNVQISFPSAAPTPAKATVGVLGGNRYATIVVLADSDRPYTVSFPDLAYAASETLTRTVNEVVYEPKLITFAEQDYTNIVGTIFDDVTVAYLSVGQVGCQATPDPTNPVGSDGSAFNPQIVPLQSAIGF
jgi:hypothetical protein